MDKVKAALTDFTSRSGHNDTTVHETVAPAVTHETVKPHQHEQIHTAVDKEVHADHFHRTVQPIQDREVLPETHTAKLGGVQRREFDHCDHDSTKQNLAQEQAQFNNERRVEGTTSSQSVAPTLGAEHVHHHIHETIQPVVHKETIQPNVVHTTIPIHKVHYNKATHHEATALPTMTMDAFKHKGGALTGREKRYDEFQGVPKNIGGGTAGGFGHIRDATPRDGHHASSGGSHNNDPSGPHDSHLANKADPRVDSDHVGTAGNTVGAGGHGTGQYGSGHGTHASNNTGRYVGTDGVIGSNKSRANVSLGHHDSTTTHKKPGLMDKLNPMKDTDGDGKKGIMD
ncbi:hypothetical protein GQ44DRAFT_809216 [Phaeosphaeriaceae sp. PMI808]|nr:hypothetical protein GQ44DRAFT_809216 [Phaeosphaeriaceae sp. PMI808]